ncbi:hypothetical protein [Terrarubrum flagellatum]|uniref:hypothetical protein n=1 Tax=Terrirubrum flagellatum TaxID=2895980 RepID=UPI003144E755
MDVLQTIVDAIVENGDLAHLALALWALAASGLCFALMRALSLANRELAAAAHEVSTANTHVKDFVRELARFNRENAAKA